MIMEWWFLLIDSFSIKGASVANVDANLRLIKIGRVLVKVKNLDVGVKLSGDVSLGTYKDVS